MKVVGRVVGTRERPSCRQVGKVLQACLDGELDPDRARRVAAHLAACRRCGLEAAAYERIVAALRAGPALPDDRDVERLRAFVARLSTGGVPPAR